MLKTKAEAELLQNALEPGIRNPKRPGYGISNIFHDFHRDVSWSNARILELGPGHFEFCEAARNRGATAEAVELDPVVAELGKRRGFQIHLGDLKQIKQLQFESTYDGLFSVAFQP
jgi:16S rRNA A1518/A1519 N6-dimethyltransferase RsmA/KsgA/DIM1 with predicted DNA glycosylase/AP lyase activity